MSAAASVPVPPRPAGLGCRCWPVLGATGPVDGELRVHQLAEPAAVPALRRRLRDWLTDPDLDLDLEPVTAEAVVLAAGEAVTNAVEHAYLTGVPGLVRLVVTRPLCGSGLGVLVEDHGRWRPVPLGGQFGGRGLLLIHRLADRATVTDTPAGTTVRMCWSH